jgi:hypothetical protein
MSMQSELETAITRQALEILFEEATTASNLNERCSLLRRLLVDDPKFELTLALLPIGPSQLSFSFRRQQSLSLDSNEKNNSLSESNRLRSNIRSSNLNKGTSTTAVQVQEEGCTDNTTEPSSPSPSSSSSIHVTTTAATSPIISNTSATKSPVRSLSVSASSSVADAILKLFNHGPRGEAHVVNLIKTIQTVEVESLSEDKVTQLFRGNTLGCKVVSTFTASVGQEYLKHTITPLILIVQEALANGVNFKDATCNEREVVLTKCLKHVLSSYDSCPYTMGTICKHLREIVRQKFPKHTNVALSSFLFLRFFCPAIVNPHVEILPDNDVSLLSTNLRRALIWIAKSIQSLANNTNVDDHDEIKKPVSWPLTLKELDVYRGKMLDYFDKVCDRRGCSSANGSSSGSSDNEEKSHQQITFHNHMELNDVVLLSYLVKDNAPLLAEMIVKQRIQDDRFQKNNRSGGSKENSRSKYDTTTCRGSKSNENSGDLVSPTNSAALFFWSKLTSWGDSSGSNNNISGTSRFKMKNSSKANSRYRSGTTSARTISTRSARFQSNSSKATNGTVSTEEPLPTPPMILAKFQSLPMNEAIAIQGTSLHFNHNTLISEYYFRVVEKNHILLHNYMKAVEDGSKNSNDNRGSSIWQHIKTDSTTSNHRISTYHHLKNPALVMERAYFPVTSEQFYQRLSSFSTRVKWDPSCLQCHEVERISPSCSILHSVTKTASAVVSNRDYVYLQSHGPDVINVGKSHQSKRVYVVVSTSVERPDCYPIKGLVRGNIDFEGFIVEEQEDDPLACVATHIISIDHKGWIPTMFARSFMADRQPSVLCSIAETLFTSVEDVAL